MATCKQSLFDLVGDLVIFRDLNPVDPRLPSFADMWSEMGLTSAVRPRKHEPAYAQAVAWTLRRARALDRPGATLAEVLYIGDTALSDGNAFRNLRAAGGWQGWAFIGAERDEMLAVSEQDGIFVANRWSALAEFVSWLRDRGALLNERTVAIVDIDKTALGARGRNDKAIDQARTSAMEALIADALGLGYDAALYRRTYQELNIARFHPFTADNQDYLAYICLIVNARVCELEELVADVTGGRIKTFFDFIAEVDANRDRLGSSTLLSLHDEVMVRVQAGDPTPFKTFRRREYLETVGRMGQLPDDAPVAQRLVEEICLTREVLDLLEWLRRRGCLLVGLSDKPDEASLPTPELAAQGLQPLHRATTHVAGPSIADLLPAS